MTAPLVLHPTPLTRAAFAPYGDVIDTDGVADGAMNDGTLERFDALAQVEIADAARGVATISLARCRRATPWPVEVSFVERHPLGSQAFIPLSRAPIVVVVAPRGGDRVDPAHLRAFASNGRQGVNYHRGVWHVPLIVQQVGQELLIVERGGAGANCDEYHFEQPVVVETAPAQSVT